MSLWQVLKDLGFIKISSVVVHYWPFYQPVPVPDYIDKSKPRCALREAENLSRSLSLIWAYFPQSTQAADIFSAASGGDSNTA